MCGTHHRHHRRTERRAHSDAPAPRTGTPPDRVTAGHLRASDAERDAAVAELREHAGAGRLGVEELDERIARALGATTRSELAAVLDDLPPAPRPRDADRERRELRDHVRSYLAVMALLVVIWAVTGAAYFWPIWPMLGWGIGVLSHANGVRSCPSGGPRPA